MPYMSEHSSHRPESPGTLDQGNSEKDFRNFLGTHQIDDQDPLNPDTAEKNVDRRNGIKALAALAFGLDQNATWADLAHDGGYDAYLQKVETLLEPRETLEFDEQ